MNEPLQPVEAPQLPSTEVAKDAFYEGLQEAMAKEGMAFTDSGKPAPEPQQQQNELIAERKLTDPPVKGKARQHFKALEESKRTAEQAWLAEKAELTKQLEELRKNTTPADNNELQELRAQLAALDITKDPEFEIKYRKPKEITVAQAANLAGERSVDVKAVLALPPGSLRDARLEELLRELPASVGAVIKAANERLIGLSFQESLEIETARQTYAQKAQAKEAQRIAEQAARSKVLPDLINAWKGQVDILDPNKDNRAAVITRDAEKYFKGEGLSAKEQAAVALKASMLDALMEDYEMQQTTIGNLQERLKRYEQSFPGSGAAESSGVSRRPMNVDERLASFNQGLEKAMNDPMYGGARR